MERAVATSRINKTQRETHSEIERKRRERMKRDTEFLRKQLADPQCKDKLSIYQAGAERLIQYTDKLGKREYIINDEEYSRIILNNFDGFSLRIRCADGMILGLQGKVKEILDMTADEIIGTTIENLAEPENSTKEIIADVLRYTDSQWVTSNGLISRNFVLALRCGPKIPCCHCIYGSDGGKYRFIEFCGDLCRQTDESNPDRTVVHFRGLCRPLDPVSGTIKDNSSGASTQHFTLRLSPNSFRIIEVVGDFQELLGCPGDNLLRKQLHEICVPSEYESVGRLLNEVQLHSPVSGSLHLLHNRSLQPLLFDVELSAIRLGSYFHCVVCRMTPSDGFKPEANADHESTASDSYKPEVYSAHVATIAQIDSEDRILRPLKTEDEHFSNQLQPIVSPSLEYTMDNQQHEHPQFGTDDSLQDPVFQHTGYSVAEDHTSSIAELPVVYREMEEEWFKNVDTSSFQNLLNGDYLASPDCYS